MRARQLDWLSGDRRFDLNALNDNVHLLPGPRTPVLEPAIREDAPFELGIIACSSSKLPHRAPARLLYTGQTFRLALQVVLRCCQRVRILSAFHGVLQLDADVDSYDRNLADYDSATKVGWGARVNASLWPWREGRVLCLAPASYWRLVPSASRWERPLAGLGIGAQKAKLAELLRSDECLVRCR